MQSDSNTSSDLRLCACGCGTPVKANRQFVTRHNFNKGTLVERFWLYVQKTDDCWLWVGPLRKKAWPYGDLSYRTGGKKKHLNASRFSYELHFGPIPNHLNVLHHCDNPKCVRPDHLFLGTQKDNMEDKVSKNRQYRPGQRFSGDVHHNAILSIPDVQEIRRLHKDEGKTRREISAIYPNVSYQTISDTIAWRRWRNV